MKKKELVGRMGHGVSQIDIFKDGKLLLRANDPSDAENTLVGMGLPNELFLRAKPYWGWSWDRFPLRFGWECHFYELIVVVLPPCGTLGVSDERRGLERIRTA